MITTSPLIAEFDYEHAGTYANYLSILDSTGLIKEEIGTCSDGVKKIYGIPLGDFSKPTIIIVANQHGSEWETAHYSIEFLRRLKNHELFGFNSLQYELSFYLIPSANPWGYENLQYNNYNGVNLNRNYDYHWEISPDRSGAFPFSEPETQIIRDTILKYKPLLVIDCHTCGEVPGEGQIYNAVGLGAPLLSFWYYDLIKSLKFNTQTDWSDWGTGSTSPLLRYWAGNQNSRHGYKTIALLCEIGGGLSIEKQSYDGINSYLLFCSYILNWFKTKKVRIY